MKTSSARWIEVMTSSAHRGTHFSLTYLNNFKIGHTAEGLHEPSGLVLSHGKKALWVVSDDTPKIFKMGLDGDLKKSKCFNISEKGLEGIAIDPTGKFLLAVKEENNAILKINLAKQAIAQQQRLQDMAGYQAIAPYFTSATANKGLEGITWNSTTNSIFVLKEGSPGLLLEVSPDLTTLRASRCLNADNGFLHPEGDELDFSDLCYDESRDRFWIISDQGQRLFLYDWHSNSVLQSARLAYGKQGQYQEIEQAEGIAINPETHRLYIVSDAKARLYVFDLRD